MTYELSCKGLGMDCSFITTAQTIKDLMAKTARHGKEVHGYTDRQLKDPVLAKKIKAAIKRK